MSGDSSFGAWLKSRRKELDLTQEQLGELAGCSPDMVGKIEGGQARPSRQLAELLVARLQVPSDRQSSFVQWARTGRPEPLSPSAGPPTAASEPFAPSIASLSAEADGRPDALANPYKGLRAFGEKDTADFFGREALTARLRERLAAAEELSRFLAVVGPSGSGKSSVVRAGLLPTLRRELLPGGLQPLIVDIVPGTHPLEEIEAALLRVAVNPPSSLLEQLRDGERGLVRAVKRVLPADGRTEMLLVIDQFEELFTLTRSEQERADLLRNLFEAMRDPSSRLWVVVTLRADFYGHPLLYVPSTELVGRRTEVVGPLTPDELYRAITGPAERAGLRLEADLPVAIIEDVAEQPGALPLLQYALTELYERRNGRVLTLRAYRQSGGVPGALARRAEELYTGLAPAERSEARQLFLRLVTLGEETGTGTEDTRRRARRSEIASAARDEEALGNVLDLFGRYRMLTFDRDPLTGGPTVEVAHEALLRSWPRLREWLDSSRERLLVQRRLMSSVAEWQAAGQEPSFLATGARLAQFASLQGQADGISIASSEELSEAGNGGDAALALTAEEHAYLAASLAEQQRLEAAEQQREVRELALQKRAASRLRFLVAGLAVFLVVAALLSVWALNRSQLAQANEQLAQDNFAHADALRVASEANNLLSAHGPSELIALLSIRSMNMQYSPQADAVLLPAADLDYPVRRFNHGATVWDLMFSPDGKYLVTSGADHMARLWDVATGQQVRALAGYSKPLNRVVFSSDGRRIATFGDEGTARIWDAATGQILLTVQQPSGGTGMDLSLDGKYLVTGDLLSAARLWDAATGRLVRVISAKPGGIDAARFSPDGKYVATGSSEGNFVQLWDTATGQPLQVFQPGHMVVFSPAGKDLLTGGLDQDARLWDIASGQLLQVFAGHDGAVTNVAYAPDGKSILTAANDNTARLWDVASGQTLQILADHSAAVFGVGFSPDGQWLATGSDDGTALLWHAGAPSGPGSAPAPGLPQFIGHTDQLWTAYFSHDGKRVVTGSNDDTLRVWDAASGRELQRIAASDLGGVLSAVFSADDKRLLTADGDEAVKLWDANTGKELNRFTGYSAEVNRALFLPGDTQIVTASADGTARVWDAAAGRELRRFTGHSGSILALAVAPDGSVVATGGGDTTVRIWDPATGEERQVLHGHSATVNDVAFSPDGKYLLTASDDGSARLWDLASGTQVRQFLGHTGQVFCVGFSADGRYALTGGSDQTARLWDAQTGQELRRFTGHRAAVRSVAFSADGKTVLTASEDGTARLWYADYHDTIHYLCSVLTRDLTPDERTKYGIADQGPTCPAH